MIDWLNEEQPPIFPPTVHAQKEPNGLLAAGGLLTPVWLVASYRQGIFPWFEDDSPILWWSPAPRMVLQPKDFHISKSLRKLMRKPPFRISCDLAFNEVIYQCAQPRLPPTEDTEIECFGGDDWDKDEDEMDAGTWITQDMMDAYIRLNDNGISHSIECWDGRGNLVGGLYGLLIDRVFFGESMFNKANNASKLAFAYLADYLFKSGVELIDCQMHSDHMARFGAKEVSREQFEGLLTSAITDTSNEKLNIKLPVFLTL